MAPRASATLTRMHGELEGLGQLSDARLDVVRQAPSDQGRLELIVRRPSEGAREVLATAHLDLELGLVGDRWATRNVQATPAYLAAQLTVMSTRVLAAIEPDRDRWPLAGDQLCVDLDLGTDNLPAGSRLAIGTAVIEITDAPHTGCAKFGARFGSEAVRWVNSPTGRANRLRGLNARVVVPGEIRVGDLIRKV